jgi:hypothetical protein
VVHDGLVSENVRRFENTSILVIHVSLAVNQ